MPGKGRDDGQKVRMENASPLDARSEVSPGPLELHVRFADGARQTISLGHSSSDVTLPGGQTIRFTPADDAVSFKSLAPQRALIYKDGISKTSGQLEVGNSLEVAGQRVLLWDRTGPRAFLQGRTAPYSNDIWRLGPGEFSIGRPGRRVNAVSLDHPTVSREHARLLGREDGTYALLAEASTNPVYLRGSAVRPGTIEQLCHGDLLEVGELIFRFHQPAGSSEAAGSRAAIEVRSFGGLEVTVDGTPLPEKAWRIHHVKWLFAHLAYAWDRSLDAETVKRELWPEADAERALTNFKFALSTLRQAVRDYLPEPFRSSEVALRSSSTLQLDPDLLNSHDVVVIQRLVRGLGLSDVSDEDWQRQASEAILAYRGPFLPDCSLPWAIEARRNSEQQMLELARALLESLEREARWEAISAIARHILEVDRQAQWACLCAMRALRKSGRAGEGLRLFEQSQEIWAGAGREAETLILDERDRLQQAL